MFKLLKAWLTNLRTCQVSGRLGGLGDSTSLIFDSPNFHSETRAKDGRYSVRLKRGRYIVSYRVLNNFTRQICDLKVSRSGERDIRFESPKMMVRFHNLPPGTQGGMVYLRHPNGSYSGRHVERFAEFEWDFRNEPAMFVDSFGEIGIEIDGSEHRFAFKSLIGGTLEIDFSVQQTSRTMPDPTPGPAS